MTESNKLRARLWQLLGDIPQATIPNVPGDVSQRRDRPYTGTLHI